jgi:hypothetical protein
MSIKMIPGRRAGKLINLYNKQICKSKFNEYLEQRYPNYTPIEPLAVYDVCPKEKFIIKQTPGNDPTQTENQRIAVVLQNSLGGRITFGNGNIPAPLNYLSRIEGMSGNGGIPPRNRF